MALPKLDQRTLDTAQKGFVRLVGNATDVTPAGLRDTITGVSTDNGFYFGGLSSAPSLGSSDEMVDQVENIYGVFGPVRGAFQIQSTTSMVTVSLLKATPRILSIVFPDWQDDGAWASADAAVASASFGTGDAAFDVTAQNAGPNGNSISVELVDPGVAGSLSVSVVGSAITVTLADDGTAVTSTASDVVSAINASAPASALVVASVPATSAGTGVVAAAAATNLSGGAGTGYGKKFSRSGAITNASYLDNVCICYEGQTPDELGMIVKLNSVLNRADDKSLEADDDGNLYGFEVELTGHEDFSGALGGARVAPMEFYLPSYMLDAAPA